MERPFLTDGTYFSRWILLPPALFHQPWISAFIHLLHPCMQDHTPLGKWDTTASRPTVGPHVPWFTNPAQDMTPSSLTPWFYFSREMT